MPGGVVRNNRNTTQSTDASEANRASETAWIQSIVREVIQRLKTETSGVPKIEDHETSLDERVVSVTTLEQLASGTRCLLLRQDAIVTPAAKDMARQQGIAIRRHPSRKPNTSERPTTPEHNTTPVQAFYVEDTDDPSRAAAVTAQLQRRSIRHGNTRIVLSDSPAATVIREVKCGQAAVMISALDQIDRFAAECRPNCWVLDTKRLNLPAVVNAAAQIFRRG